MFALWYTVYYDDLKIYNKQLVALFFQSGAEEEDALRWYN